MNGSTHLGRLVLLLILVLVAPLSVGLPAPAHLTAAAARIEVVTDIARSDFPNGVTFALAVESRRRISRIELLYTTAGLETLNLSAPRFSSAKRVELTHTLDFRSNYLPAGIDITYRWRISDDRNATVETEPRTLLWEDTRFDWQAVSSDDVTVYAYNQNEAFNRLILASAQETVDRLVHQFGLERIEPIRIWVYNSKQDFAATQASNSSHWIAGTAYPQLRVILAILPEGNKREVGRVVPHEISHQVLYQATKNPFNAPPTWLDEGIAVLNQDTGHEDFPALVQDAAERGRLFSIRALNSDFPFDPADASLAYAQSYSIVLFIIDRFGEDALADLIAAYREGVSHDTALQAALGVDLDELDRLWKDSLGDEEAHSRSVGATRSDSAWTDFAGPALASGSLVMFAAALGVVVIAIAGLRRSRRAFAEADSTLYPSAPATPRAARGHASGARQGTC